MDGRANPGRETRSNGANPPRRAVPDRARRPAHRSPERDELPMHGFSGGPADPPPPAREQLPLPRRRQQAHLEPQLRTPGDPGSGTPFAAFTAHEPGPVAPADRDLPTEFQDGSRRARRDVRRRARPAE